MTTCGELLERSRPVIVWAAMMVGTNIAKVTGTAGDEERELAKDIDAFLAQPEEAREAVLAKTLRGTAQLYHEAKHFILGEVDRERFPSYLECPYWPCVDARAALADTSPAAAALLAQGERLGIVQELADWFECDPEAVITAQDAATRIRAALASPAQGDKE